MLIFSCNKKTENKNELDILRTSTNIKTYPVGKMDSIQAIKSITQQKVQELLDLSALYINGIKILRLIQQCSNRCKDIFINQTP